MASPSLWPRPLYGLALSLASSPNNIPFCLCLYFRIHLSKSLTSGLVTRGPALAGVQGPSLAGTAGSLMSGPHGSTGLRYAEGGLPGTHLAWKVQARRAQGLTKALLGATSSFGHKSPLWGGIRVPTTGWPSQSPKRTRGPGQSGHPPAGGRDRKSTRLNSSH